MLKIQTVPVGALRANCYLVSDSETQDAMIIDPGAQPDRILSVLSRHSWKVKYIINTHGHYDHVGANGPIQQATQAPIYMHPLDFPVLEITREWGPVDSPVPGKELADGQVLAVGAYAFVVIHTPGHSQGGICLYGNDVVFTGDTLFAGGIGRYDFPGSSKSAIMDSLKRLLELPDATIVYPGHGPSTTIGTERVANMEMETMLGERRRPGEK